MPLLIDRSGIFFLAVVLCNFGLEVDECAAGEKPNVVFIMVDDMGYGDLGCYNPESKISTPNIDRLASQGMRFTDAHAPAAVCVPTRFGLMTGSYPFRMTRGGQKPLIPPEQLTVGKLLQKHGYRTGMIGKWHLGVEHEKDPPANTALPGGPVDRGFDSFFGIPASLDIPPYYYIKGDRAVAPPGLTIGDSNSEGWTKIQGAFWRAGGIAPGYKHVEVTPKFTEEAVSYLAEQSTNKPFFLYLAYPSPHTPWMPTEEFNGRSKAGMYGDFVAQVDASIGQVLKQLDELNLSNNTLLFVTSDNGPVWYDTDTQRFGHSSTGTMRGMKAWEGGHRMPFLVRWLGRIAAGSTTDQLACHTDLMATLAELLDSNLPDDAGPDSFSMLSTLLDQKPTGIVRTTLVSQSSRGYQTIRGGSWKLIPGLGSGGFSQPSKETPQPGGPNGQLYDLDEDPSETTNLYQKHPETVALLTKLFKKYTADGRSR
jgi:arylsulfatase A